MESEHEPSRRGVVSGLGAAALTAGLVSRAAAADKAGNLVVEWNQHMFSQNVAKFPYSPKATYRPDPEKNPPDPLAAYQKRLKDEGIDKAVIVQPEPYGDDHTLVLDCLHRTSPDLLKGTSLFYPKDADAPQKLAALVKANPRICSTRFHLHRGNTAYFESFAEPGVRALWGKAVDLGLVIELDIGPNYARNAGEAIAAFPGCKVLIDHLANPKTGTSWEFADVLDLAKYPGVYMKLSGVGYIANDKPNYESVLPFTRRIIKEFGADRMVWGGDSHQIVDVHMKGYPAADIAKVKGGNFKRLLNW